MGTLSIGTIEQSCSSSFAFRLSTEAQRSRKSDESRVSRIAQRLRSDLSRSLLARSVCNGEKFSWPEFLTPKKSEAATKKHSRGQVIFSRASSRIRPSRTAWEFRNSSLIQKSLQKSFFCRPDHVCVGSRAPFDGRDMQGIFVKSFPSQRSFSIHRPPSWQAN